MNTFISKQLSINSAFLFVYCLFFTIHCNAQNANVRGFVYAKDNGEPALFTNVYLKGTTYAAVTDVNGFYSISKVPKGDYTLVATYLGYDTVYMKISITTATQIINEKLYLNKAAVQLTEVVATGEQQAKKENTRVSVTRIDPVEIKKLPSVGQPDLAQYLQVLPGVTFTGDQGGQLYIRGGSPVQNKVLLDGMIIYNPFHSIGLFSVFDNDIIKNADVYTAGFGAEYGGRTSSVMDITTRDGNKKKLSSKVSVSTFGAKAMLEGPLVKLKEDGNTSLSFVVSGKTSYLPTTSKWFYPYAEKMSNPYNTGQNNLPFSYNDLYGKLSLNSTNGSKLSLFGFDFNDKVDYTGIASFKWNSVGGGANFVVIPAGNNTLIEGNFAYSQYRITEQTATIKDPNSSLIGGFNGGFKFTNFFGRVQLNYGIELQGYHTNFDFHAGYNNLEVTQTGNSTEIAGYLKLKYVSKNKRLVLEPSFRLHEYASLNQLSPEPRFSGKFNITDRVRFKTAAGLYSQNLVAANSDQDVVNLFYGFLFSPDNLQSYYTKKQGADSIPVSNKLQRANHLVAGFEFDLFKNIEVNIEGYQKYFTFLTNVNRYQLFNTDAQHVGYYPDYQVQSYIVETGYSRGFDVTIKYEKNRFYLWTVYSYSYNKRWDGIQLYSPVFDRRHNINIVATYGLDKKKHWEISARWNFGTGFPFTPTQGYYQQLDLSNYMNVNVTQQNGQLGYLAGQLFSQRLPTYHRLDISIRCKYTLKDRLFLEVNAGCTNVYNRANIFYFNRVTYQRVNQMPIMPNLNITIGF